MRKRRDKGQKRTRSTNCDRRVLTAAPGLVCHRKSYTPCLQARRDRRLRTVRPRTLNTNLMHLALWRLRVCGKRGYHKHQSTHHHKEADETPHWHEVGYRWHFSLDILTTDWIKEHKQSFRRIGTKASQATVLMPHLEINRKMVFSQGNVRLFQPCLHVSH